MPIYRIHRLRESQRIQFRQSAHTAGLALIKPKDYAPGESCEASSPYGAWSLWKETDEPLEVGDVLECDSGRLFLCKYIGFEEAQWTVPEAKVCPEPQPASPGGQTTPLVS